MSIKGDVNMIETGTYQKLLTLLEERTVNEERAGLEITVKRIPDSDGEGELDPRVFDVLNVPDQEFPELGNVDVKDVPFDKIREMMGWPNTDVTTSGIQTIYQSIEGRNGSIPIRIYTPKENLHPLPCIVYFHGGGFIGGSVDTLDNPCKALAEKGSAVVVSVDYR
jgi:acetyl esterase